VESVAAVKSFMTAATELICLLIFFIPMSNSYGIQKQKKTYQIIEQGPLAKLSPDSIVSIQKNFLRYLKFWVSQVSLWAPRHSA